MFLKETTNTQDLIKKVALKIKEAERISNGYYDKRVWTAKYYEQMSLTLLDYFLTQIPPSKLAEYQKLREKGWI